MNSWTDMLPRLREAMPRGCRIAIADKVEGGSIHLEIVTVEKWTDEGWLHSSYGMHGFGGDATVYNQSAWTIYSTVPAGRAKETKIRRIEIGR